MKHITIRNHQLVAALILALPATVAGCGDDTVVPLGSEEPNLVPRAQSSADAFPPGVRIVHVDPSLPMEEALAQVRTGTTKNGGELGCLVHTYALEAIATGEYVTVDLGDGNRLKAQGWAAAEWERFKICTISYDDNTIALWSVAAQRWVAAEFGYTGGAWAQLRARSTEVSVWETLIAATPDGPGVFTYRIATDETRTTTYYVTAEFGWGGVSYGKLRARSQFASDWERFRPHVML